MSKTLYENLLKKFKKANKARRLVIAGAAGYDSPEQYQSFLEGQISSSEPVKKEQTTTDKPVISVIDIVDTSGSMGSLHTYNSKISSAQRGVKEGVSKLKKSEVPVIYNYGLCSFSGANQFKMSLIQPIGEVSDNVSIFPFYGGTALNDAIVKIVLLALELYKEGNQVLINFYTDGGEAHSEINNYKDASKAIEDAKDKGITITFICLKIDKDEIIRNYGIDESNILVYDGTSEGLSSATVDTITARELYASAVTRGEIVTNNFYSKVKL